MHETLGIKGGQRRCTKSKHEEARALREREELATIIRSASQESTFEPTNEKQKKVGVGGF
jgi:hypothetical protein